MTKSRKRFSIGEATFRKPKHSTKAGRTKSKKSSYNGGAGWKPKDSKELFETYLHTYSQKRKALAKDKDGIRLDISPINTSFDLNISFNKNRGKHSVEVEPSQLKLNNNILKFRCSIYNERRTDVMVLTAAAILDASSLAACYDDKENWMKSKEFVQIKPKEEYDGVVIKFQIAEPVFGSYKIPLAVNLKEESGAAIVTLCRTIVIKINDPKVLSPAIKVKSPFTGLLWGRIFIVQSKYNYFGKLSDSNHVTKQIYEDYFHNCLWLDELTNRKMLQNYNMENVTMTIIDGSCLKLKVPGLEENRPNLLQGDEILVRVHEDHTCYRGYIKSIEYHYQYITIERIENELLDTIHIRPETELDVNFQLGTLPLERAHRGVEIVCSEGILESLFPTDRVCTKVLPKYELHENDFINQMITKNEEQRTAIENILNCTSQGAPYIVYGPPGTGKTITIVEAICQILKKTDKTILVCAPANSACDMLAAKLMQHCTKKELIRVHSESRDRSTIAEDIQDNSNCLKNDIYGVTCEELTQYRIVVTTLILIGRYSEQGYTPDYLFIDEAAQASEPDTCVALSIMKLGGNVVLAGDPKQLGPIVHSKIAQEHGLDISLLERLMDPKEIYGSENPRYITMLKKNFRSHADILRLPNELFYESKLVAVSEEAQSHPVSKFDVYSNIKKFQCKLKKGKHRPKVLGQAVEFCSVYSKELREGRSPSYFNPSEADMVIECIKTLHEANFGPNFKIKLSDIGVITPYIRQVYKIRSLLDQNNLRCVEVGSTESFQGREKRIIIISTVRAKHDLLKIGYQLGFVAEAKRFNVAATRAMSKLIVIGCPKVLGTNHNWALYIEQCKDLGSYHGFPLEERSEEKMREIIERFQQFPKLSYQD